MKKVLLSDITDTVVVCPYCMNEAGSRNTCCGEIHFEVAYEVNGEVTTDLPCDLPNLTNLKPIYEELPGWKEDLETATSLDDIPANCLAYVKRVEELAGAPVAAISVGPAREQTIIIPGVSSGLN